MMKHLLGRAATQLALVASALVIGLVGTASAYAAPGAATHYGSSIHTARASATTATGCDVTFYGKPGTAVCGTDVLDEYFADGTVRRFVIGTDYAVWNIVHYGTGGVSDWRSLGGDARVGVYDYSTTNSSTLTIWTYGTNGIPYCDSLASSSWSGFYRC